MTHQIRTTLDVQKVIDIAHAETRKVDGLTIGESVEAIAKALSLALRGEYHGVHIHESEVLTTLAYAAVHPGTRGERYFPWDGYIAALEDQGIEVGVTY